MTKERYLDGKIIWISKAAYHSSYSKKEYIYTAPINKAVLSGNYLNFSCSDTACKYELKLIKIKDTNYQGKILCHSQGEIYEFPIHLQVFENRLGIMLEGEWNTDEDYYLFAELHYV